MLLKFIEIWICGLIVCLAVAVGLGIEIKIFKKHCDQYPFLNVLIRAIKVILIILPLIVLLMILEVYNILE